MKEDEAKELEAALAKVRSAGGVRGRGYPEDLRARAVAYTERCRGRGETMQDIASRLGFSVTTLSSWLRLLEPTTTFAPVKVTAATRVVVVSPSGWRAEIELSAFAKLVSGRA